MSLFLTGISMLALSFAVHVVLWRTGLVKQGLGTLLLVFLATPTVALLACFATGTNPYVLNLSMAEALRVCILYVSCSLAYIAVYSGLESESPTLSIISLIARRGEGGCEEQELFDRMQKKDDMAARLGLMEASGLIGIKHGFCNLTMKGRFFSNLFALAAWFFRIPLGG